MARPGIGRIWADLSAPAARSLILRAMTDASTYVVNHIDRRLAEGWDAARQALAQILALTGWTLIALPTGARIAPALHRAALALLRPAEKQVRRILIVLAARLPAPTLRPTKPPAALDKTPPVTRIEIRGPLHEFLHPTPPPSRPERPARPRGFQLIEPSGRITPAAYLRPPPGPKRARPDFAPRLSLFEGETCHRFEFTAPQSRADEDTRNADAVAARMAALQHAIDNPALYARRLARWNARRKAGREPRRTPLHWRPIRTMRRIPRPRHGGWIPPEPLIDTLDFLAREALDTS